MSSERVSNPGDAVATWDLRLNDGPHTVTFEHGTTSGKRVIIVDGQEVYIYKVVARHSRPFSIGFQMQCTGLS